MTPDNGGLAPKLVCWRKQKIGNSLEEIESHNEDI